MSRPSGRAWKLERASVHVRGRARPRSNKYSGSDSHRRPETGEREKCWVGGYTRADGVHVRGHFRKIA